MSKSDTWETQLLNLVFNNTGAANIGDATGLRGSTTAGSLYVSLHTADPTDAGNQSSNEVAYTSYARVAVARSSGGWTISGGTVNPAAPISFPAGTGGSGTATYFGIGVAASGATALLYSGPISPSIVCGAGVTPVLGTGSAVTED